MLKYGNDFDAYDNELTSSQKTNFYSKIVPKIIELLESERYDSLTEEDNEKLMELIREKLSIHYDDKLSLSKAIIVVLKFGYLNDKLYSNNAISNLFSELNIEPKKGYVITQCDVEKVNEMLGIRGKTLEKSKNYN